MDTKKTAKQIVEAILRDLSGRSGIGNELDAVRDNDEEVWRELKDDLVSIVEKELKAAK